jgi:hypothetical protein
MTGMLKGLEWWGWMPLTCCDKLSIDRVLVLSISDAADVFLSPVGHSEFVSGQLKR